MVSTRIGPVDVVRDGEVVRIRQRRGTGDLVLALTGLVGLAGVASIATNPVSVATWLLGPFMVAFAVFGLGGSVVRLVRRDEVVVDPGRRQMSTFGRTVAVPGRMWVEVVTGAAGVRRTWHVDLVSSEGSLRVADFVDQATAKVLAAELPPVIAWTDPT